MSGLLGKAASYVFSSGLNSAIPFLLMPIFTRYLSPDDMGHVAMFTSAMNLFGIAIGLYLPGSTSVRYFKKEGIALPAYMGTGLVLVLCSAALVSLLAAAFAPVLQRYTGLSLGWLLLGVLSATWQVVIQLQLKLMQMRGLALRYAFIQNLYTLAIMAASVWLVVALSMGWPGRVYGHLGATIGVAIVLLGLMLARGTVRLGWNREYAKDILAFGLPLIPHGIGSVAVVLISRAVLNTMAGMHDVGLYSVAAQLAMVISLVATAVNQAYSPWLYRRLASPTDALRRKLVQATYLYFVVALAGAGLVTVASPWFVSFYLGERYAGASEFLMWLAFGAAFTGMYYMVTNYLFYHRKTGRLAGLTLALGAFSVLSSILFIRINGAVGAAQAVCLSNFLLFICTWAMAARVERLPWFSFWRRTVVINRRS